MGVSLTLAAVAIGIAKWLLASPVLRTDSLYCPVAILVVTVSVASAVGVLVRHVLAFALMGLIIGVPIVIVVFCWALLGSMNPV
jgi:hypothetical protein